jgi:hypothetical protein
MVKARAEVKGCVKLNVELVYTAEETKPVVEATASLGAMLSIEAGGFVESNYSAKTTLESIAAIKLT